MAVEDFGERAATPDEVTAYKALVRQGKNASHGYKKQPNRADSMRPQPGSGKASSEA